jgi:uncharacterized membrane protein YwaF
MKQPQTQNIVSFFEGFFFYQCTSVDANSLVSTNLVFLAVENALATCKKKGRENVCVGGGAFNF